MTDLTHLQEEARTSLLAGRLDRLHEAVLALEASASKEAAQLAREIRLVVAQRTESAADGEWAEPLDAAPHAIARIVSTRGVLVARKSLAREWIHDEIEEPFSSAITARMLLGVLDDAHATDAEVRVRFRGLAPADRRAAFDDVCRDPWAAIEYPFVPLFGPERSEFVAPPSDWDPTPRRCEELDNGEAPLRRHAAQMLADEDLHGRVIYDPACSTGTFLHALKEQHPGCRTIGQDLHPGMVEHARGRVDEIHLGNAKEPVVDSGTVDLLLLRFLCWGSVSRVDAPKLFERLVDTVRVGGRVLLLGHTPVLLTAAQMEAHGLEASRRSGYDPATGTVFQFYVLKKTGR